MRSIGVVTVARSDYGIYRPILRRIQADPDLQLGLFVSGAHLSPDFGLTVREIERDGFAITERIETLLSSGSAEGISKAMGLGVIGFAQAFTRARPDLLLVLGDRFDMFAAVVAALPFNLPVAHIHGGEATFGAIDDSLRHAITKLSHLHFAATPLYAKRLIQLGEAPWRVTISGAPALDQLTDLPKLDVAAFKRTYQVDVTPPPLLVTYHPVTLEAAQAADQMEALLGALDEVACPVIFTDPNADTANHVIRERIVQYVATHARAWRVPNFGAAGYYDALRICAAMVGNSSSGLIEAPSFQLPVVNIGTRQAGRVRAANVIDVGYERAAIAQAIRRAVSAEFRAGLRGLVNPYGDGHAAERIVERLASIELNTLLIRKIFHDMAGPAA